jgi:hypothetical protein
MTDRLINLKELRQVIGYGPDKIRAMVSAGELPAPVLGGATGAETDVADAGDSAVVGAGLLAHMQTTEEDRCEEMTRPAW